VDLCQSAIREPVSQMVELIFPVEGEGDGQSEVPASKWTDGRLLR
jgi:hypothetical protein